MKFLYLFSKVLLVSAFLITGTACIKSNTGGQEKAGRKLSAAASFYAMYDFSKKIGGVRVNVTNLTPAGVDPHDWEPSPQDIIKIEKSDVLVANGASMEGWLDAVTNSLKASNLVIAIASSGISYITNKDPAETMVFNPHTWLYPLNAVKEIANIRDAFIKADPSGKAYYNSNYTLYSGKFLDLDKDFKDAALKFRRKEFVVSHQAYDYLCSAYGLKQLPVEGVAAEAEPSAEKMAKIEKFIKKNHVKVIFGEELLSPKIEKTLAHDTGITNITINPLEGLSDAEIAAGKEYISIMEDNLKEIEFALD